MPRAVFNMQDERPVWAPPVTFIDTLRAAFPAGWELLTVAAPVSGRGDGAGVSEDALRAIRGAEIYFGLGLPRDLLLAGLAQPARLRWIHTGAAGVRSLLHPELAGTGIVLTNSAGVHAEPIAETVIGMMLHFARGFDHAVRAQQRAEWRADLYESNASGVREITGAVLGIIGYGGIGRAVARRGNALGMRVIALRRSAAGTRDVDDGTDVRSGGDQLDPLLEQSDFVVVTVPSTSQTRGMIGAPELGHMKRTAVLINVARGDVIDEAAVAAALESGMLRGAGLDVFAQEPLPADSPLWLLPNVLVTPHVSATSPRYWEREGALILDNVARYLDRRPLRNVVDTDAGY